MHKRDPASTVIVLPTMWPIRHARQPVAGLDLYVTGRKTGSTPRWRRSTNMVLLLRGNMVDQRQTQLETVGGPDFLFREP
jgi:hypothetical protein